MAPERDRPYHRLAPFLGEFRHGHPVLVYHKLGRPRLTAANKGLFVSPRLFDLQLAELKMAGFASRAPGMTTPDGQCVSITFDDGYASVFRHALEPLLAHGFRAIQFMATGFIGKTSSWDRDAEPLMDRAQIRDWLGARHRIGAHTVNHVRLTRVDEAVAREEITASRKFLEDEFGVPVEHFCYPYGDWNPRVADLAAEAGFKTACTTDYGVNTPDTGPFALKRIHAYVPIRTLAGLWYYLRG